jgi:uracil-DNA glycosylase
MDLEDVYEAYRAEELFGRTKLRRKSSVLLRGRGSETPKVLIVGPAPSAVDTVNNRVFDGLPGVVLESLMHLAGLHASWTGKQTGLHVPPGCAEGVPPNARITYLVKYRADNRPPGISEQLKSVEYLRQEWAALGGPRVIVAVGDVVWKCLGPPTAGSIHWVVGQEWTLKGNVALWPMYHPNYGIKHEEMQEKMEEHWERFGAALREEGIL